MPWKKKIKVLLSGGKASKQTCFLLFRRVKLKSQQEMLNGPAVCVPKELVQTQYFCQTCNLWIHKRCSEVKRTLKKESMFRCKKCKGESVPSNSLNSTQVHVSKDTFDAVPTFQYLGDVIGESGGCTDATSARITAARKGFRELLPIITNHGISLRNQGNIFSSCIRKSLLYGC